MICCKRAVKDDVVVGMSFGVTGLLAMGVDTRGVYARACGDIISARAELVGVVSVKAMSNSEVENSG